MHEKIDIPVIDLFAGPGGLSEGFSQFSPFFKDQVDFRIKLSIEKNELAYRTLRLRAFFRQFPRGKAPLSYYRYLQAADPTERAKWLQEMQNLPEWKAAEEEAWNAELGEVHFDLLHSRIHKALGGSSDWVLLGGPPCQAYSIVGRARRLGVGKNIRALVNEREIARRTRDKVAAFYSDAKHTLYREYLEIVAIHQPSIFVMENVKGILSAKLQPDDEAGLDGVRIFERIVEDLKDPWKVLGKEYVPRTWKRYGPGTKLGYQVYSFIAPTDFSEADEQTDYLIRAEDYGVPQQRHRVILLGIRDDLDLVPEPMSEMDHPPVSVRQIIGNLPRLRSGLSRRVTVNRMAKLKDSADSWLEAVRASVTDKMLDAVSQPEIRDVMTAVCSRRSTALTRGGAFVEGDFFCERAPAELAKWLYDPRLKGICQHETREHMQSDFARYLFVSAFGAHFADSPKLRHFPKSFLPNHDNVRGPSVDLKVFHDRFRVQLAEDPATTITSHIRKDGHAFIHYDPRQCRSLTVREAARIQTFPDNYFFEGSRTDQYEQVGNAVPPYLALQLARVVAALIRNQNSVSRQPAGRTKVAQ
jgi:DNA (cytosine-5)-methyltransferase 1